VSATDVYWSLHQPPSGHDELLSVSVGGGAPITVATGLNVPGFLASNSTGVYWAEWRTGGFIETVPLGTGN
jgi:hypothetical protein